MSTLEKPEVTLGFIPLTDCAPLVIAQEKDFFRQHGLSVTLSKETSWANIRDKLSIGVLDGAQLLAPMVVASHLGLAPMQKPVITGLNLDLNGNAVTVSSVLYQELLDIDADTDPLAMAARPVSALPLKRLIEQRRAQGRAPLVFGTVFPFSSHNYLLRYWLAAAGIDPDRDLRLIVIPPPQMVSRLRKREIDGYCVGEPWNAVAVREGLGQTLVTSLDIWRNHPEKVFGVNEEWGEQHPETHLALITALLEAQCWIDQPANRPEVVEIISRSVYVNAPADVVRMSMMGTFQYAHNDFPQTCPSFNVFYRNAASYPWRSHAIWWLTQMLRWRQAETPFNLRSIAESAYRPDVYRHAATGLGLRSPPVDYKFEGQHPGEWRLAQIESEVMGADLFCDDKIFDPTDPIGYLESFSSEAEGLNLAGLKFCNLPWDESELQARLATERPMVA